MRATRWRAVAGWDWGAEQEMPPEWVDITDAIHTDTNKVKDSSQ